MSLVPIAPDARKGKLPCGECHIRPGETCDICSAKAEGENIAPSWIPAVALGIVLSVEHALDHHLRSEVRDRLVAEAIGSMSTTRPFPSAPADRDAGPITSPARPEATASTFTDAGTAGMRSELEPTFTIRAQDIVSGSAVRAWIFLADEAGADPETLASARQVARQMDAWPEKKVADRMGVAAYSASAQHNRSSVAEEPSAAINPLSQALHDNADLAAKLAKALRDLADAEQRYEQAEADLQAGIVVPDELRELSLAPEDGAVDVFDPAAGRWVRELLGQASPYAGEVCPSVALVKSVAGVIGDHRISYGARLTKMVDGVSTYTATVEGHDLRDFDDMDDALEWARDVADMNRAKLVISTLARSATSGAPAGGLSLHTLLAASERYQAAVKALGEDSGYNKLTFFEAPIGKMPNDDLIMEAVRRWRELNEAGNALTAARETAAQSVASGGETGGRL